MACAELARTLDRSAEPVLVAWAYELAWRAGECAWLDLVNLAFVYFNADDAGFQAAHALPMEFANVASRRWVEVLDEAQRTFPEAAEPRFWRDLFLDARARDDGAAARLNGLLQSHADTLVSGLWGFGFLGLEQHRESALQLLRSVEPRESSRSRYVWSVLHRRLQPLRSVTLNPSDEALG